MLHTVKHLNSLSDLDAIEGELIAVLWTDSVRWQPSSFEGPPEPIRYYKAVVRTEVGRVVRTYGRDERIMSDVWAIVTYATVWDGNDGFFDVACHNSEMGCPDLGSIGLVSVAVDAPEAIVAYHECWAHCRELERQEAERKAYAEACRKRAEAEAKEPRKGRRVKVVRGRKVPVGTVGECIWHGDGRYGARVGIKDSAGAVHWTAASNCEAVTA